MKNVAMAAREDLQYSASLEAADALAVEFVSPLSRWIGDHTIPDHHLRIPTLAVPDFSTIVPRNNKT
jgi:hypothetical protein